MRVDQIWTGSDHVLVRVESGRFYGWGLNDRGQLGDDPELPSIVTTPSLLSLDSTWTSLVCGPKQTILWREKVKSSSIPKAIPFVLDLNKDSFRHLNELLDDAMDKIDGRCDKPPKQAHECIAVAVLNLLKLQFHAVLVHQTCTDLITDLGPQLLDSLKRKVSISSRHTYSTYRS